MKKNILAMTLLLNSAAYAVSDDDIIVIHNELQSKKNSYWTEERLSNAINVDHLSIGESEFQELMKMNFKSRDTKDSQNYLTLEGDHFNTLDAEIPGRADVTKRPFKNGGKLFFTKPDGKNYVCSGQFIGKKNIVLTAAHCVINGDTGIPYKNIIFYRGYNNGGGQKIDWNCIKAPMAWSDPQNLKYDMRFLIHVLPQLQVIWD